MTFFKSKYAMSLLPALGTDARPLILAILEGREDKSANQLKIDPVTRSCSGDRYVDDMDGSDVDDRARY